MNELQIFNNAEFGEIRTTEIYGKIYFCGADVAKALGYTNTSKALKDHARYVTKCYTPHPQNPNKQIAMSFIPKSDIFRLAANSKLPDAERFESWIFDEVLPTIETHGAYMTPQTLEQVLLNPDTLIQLAQNLKAEQERNKQLTAKIESDKPKVQFAERLSVSDSTILVRELATLIQQNGVKIGQNDLYAWLRDNGYVVKRKGTDYNTPTKKSLDLGVLVLKEDSLPLKNGATIITKTTRVTVKGQKYFLDKLINEMEG